MKSLDEAYICLKLACLVKNAPPNIIEYFGAAMLPSRPSTIQLFLEFMPSKYEPCTGSVNVVYIAYIVNYTYICVNISELNHISQ